MAATTRKPTTEMTVQELEAELEEVAQRKVEDTQLKELRQRVAKARGEGVCAPGCPLHV